MGGGGAKLRGWPTSLGGMNSFCPCSQRSANFAPGVVVTARRRRDDFFADCRERASAHSPPKHAQMREVAPHQPRPMLFYYLLRPLTSTTTTFFVASQLVTKHRRLAGCSVEEFWGLRCRTPDGDEYNAELARAGRSSRRSIRRS